MKPNAALSGALLADPGPGQSVPGLVYAANDSRFTSAQYNEPLTAYAVGWKDASGVKDLLDRMFPPVPVPPRFSFKKADNSEAYISETDDVRAIGSAFKRVEYTGAEVEARVYNKGLMVRLDKDEYKPGEGWEERFAENLRLRLARNELRRGVAVLDAVCANAAKTWSATSNPDGDIRAALRLAKAGGGLRPNKMVMGGAAWDARVNAYEANTTNLSLAALSQKTPAEVAQRLMLDDVIVSEAIYTTQSGDAAPKNDILGLKIYLYYALAGLMKDDPSNVKRFVSTEVPGGFRVYTQDFSKFREITVEHYSNIIATSTLGARSITVTTPF